MANRGVIEGKHYLELTLSIPAGTSGPSTWSGLGVIPTSALEHGRVFLPRIAAGLAVRTGRGKTMADGDVVMLAIDLERKLAYWGLNGEWMNGVPQAQGGEPLQAGPSDQWTPFVNVTGPSSNPSRLDGGERWTANFGAKPFRYSLPLGFNSYGSTAAAALKYSSRTAGTTPSSSPPPPTGPKNEILMGKTFQDLIRVQTRPVPLPEGTWTVLAYFRDSGNGEAMVLGKVDGRKLRGMVGVSAHQFAQKQGSRAFAPCTRQDYVFRHVDTYDADGDQRCWWINHAMDLWQGQPLFQAAQLELTRLGVTPPGVMLNVSFRRADPQGFTTAFYYFDPSEDAISSTPGAWANSEWHRSRIDGDPARRAYVEKLQHWGEGWAGVFYASK